MGSALAAALVLSGCGGGPGAGRPSLLLVTIDTLRADRVGCYGALDAGTATLDALAARGTRFATAIASTPMTLPSHATLLTGLQPPRHGVRYNAGFALGEGTRTLAEHLEGAGYATGAVIGSFVLARRFGLAQGFHHYDDRVSPRRAVFGGFLERDARAVTDAALAWLGRAREPFFLWVHYYDPHAEYKPPEPFAGRYAGRPYQGEIAYVDAELGRLLAALRADGRLESTLVAATADHGESLGEHGERTHSYTLYDATLAVPLLLAGPGVPRGRVVPDVVGHTDLAPTLVRLLGLPELPGVDGRDLSAAWQGGLPARPAYAETLATRFNHGWSALHAARSASHHYVRAPRPELYDLAADPGQLHDLLGPGRADPALVAALDAELARVLVGGVGAEPAPLDAGTRRRLAALGYALEPAPEPAAALDPKDGLVWLEHYFEAHRALEASRLDEAQRLLEELLAEVPTSALAARLLARVHVLEGRAERALPLVEATLERDPGSVETLALLGDVKLQLRDPEGAERAYRAALELDPEDPKARSAEVWLEARAGRLERALEAERLALEASPSDAELRRRVARFWEWAGEYERSLAAYRAAEALTPDAGDLQMELAIGLARLGREEESRAHLARAGDAARVPHLLNRLAIVYAARGERERAERIFRRLVESDPDYGTARRNLEILRRQAGAVPAAADDAG
jgi:arylsulfatase A-like enzyme/Flp pilus assembly protein TadD